MVTPYQADDPAAGRCLPLARDSRTTSVSRHTNREMANRLAVPLRTIEARRARAMTELGVTSGAQLARYALDRGLVDHP